MKNPDLPAGVPRNLQRTTCAQKHDRLGWTVGSAFRWQNLRVGLRTNQSSLLPRLEEFLPRGSVKIEESEVEILISLRVGEAAKRRGQTNYHLVYHAWDRVVRTLDLEEAVLGFQELLAERCALHCSEPFFVKGFVWSSELGDIALHGTFSEQPHREPEPLPGYIGFDPARPRGLAGIAICSEVFQEVVELTAGRATVRALNLNLAPYFLADAAGCLHRFGSYFSQTQVFGVPPGCSLHSIQSLFGKARKEDPVAG